MDDPGGTADLSSDEVLAVFEQSGSAAVPLATGEVDGALDAPRDAVVGRLESLVEQGDLRTKRVGEDGRIWWLPVVGPTGGADGSVPSGEYALELEFRSENLAGPSGHAASADQPHEFEVSIEGDVSLPDGGRLQYYSATGIGPKEFVEVLERFDSVRDVRLLGISDGACRAEAEIADDSLSETFDAFGGRMKAGFYSGGTHHAVGEVPGDADVDALVDAVQSVYPAMQHRSTRRIVTSRQFYRIADTTLTERQFTVLQLAFHGGYFQQPRESTGEDLATRLGITKQTFNVHLRKALQALFEELFREAEPRDTDWSA